MAHTDKVMRSINQPDQQHCVDIFQRPDGSFGFNEFRRDVEDPSGWFPVAHHGYLVFDSEQAAFEAACLNVSWLDE